MVHLKGITESLKLASKSRKQGNHPFGAVLVYEGDIVMRAENQVVTRKDVTMHAELVLVSEASVKLPRRILKKCTLFASTEPCAMCAGAIYWAGIRKVVFALSAQNLGAMTTGSFVVSCRDIFRRAAESVEVIGPVEESAAKAVHEGFWQ